MKILVTGGTGFIGSKVVDLLVENGHSVRLYSRHPGLPERLAGKDVSLFSGDLREPDSLLDAMAGMDRFYHIGELKNTTPRAAEKNVQLVERIIDHLGKSGIKRLIFVSSLTVAGIPSRTPATEETAPAVVLEDHYTRYKLRCENLLAEEVSGAEFVVVRPGVVYGSGSRHLGGLITAIERFGPIGFPFIGKGGAVAPLIHVQDLARALYRAGIEPGAANRIFNLSDGLGHTWSDFFSAIAASCGTKFRIIPLPSFALHVPARFFDLMGGLFNIKLSLDNYVRYATADLLFDTAQARQILNWAPEFDLSKGVEEMVRGHRKERP